MSPRPHPLRTHAFLLVAPCVVAGDVYLAHDARGEIDRLIEAALLLELAVLVPCLYWLCDRERGRSAVLRATALACLGIWAALKLVPESEHDLLGYVSPLRYAGLAVLVWLELALLLTIYRTVFGGGSLQEAAAKPQKNADLPLWLARLLAWEALLMRRLWRQLKR